MSRSEVKSKTKRPRPFCLYGDREKMAELLVPEYEVMIWEFRLTPLNIHRLRVWLEKCEEWLSEQEIKK